MDSNPVIVAKNLIKRYKGSDEEALKGVNLTVKAGEFFGLLGPNSAGKTTFTSIICGLIRPTSGSVDIFNTDITQSFRSLKKSIGLVPQEIALYDTLTVEENIMFFGHLTEIHGQKLRNKKDELVRIFNLDEHKSKLISRCSGGIKRRVNLICGIIHEPSLLILDEPTLGVDTQLREMIFEYLADLNKNGYNSHIYNSLYEGSRIAL